jgi:hypothetical protein
MHFARVAQRGLLSAFILDNYKLTIDANQLNLDAISVNQVMPDIIVVHLQELNLNTVGHLIPPLDD